MTWKNGEYQPKQERADRKKGLILDAALDLFGTRGFHATTAKDVAAKAGVATGTFYRCFVDKKALFMAVCQRIEREIGEQLFESGLQMRREGHPEPRILASLVGRAIAAHHQNKAFHREVMAMQIADPDIAAWAREREKRFLTSLLEFMWSSTTEYRVRDLEAAAELVLAITEEVAHRAVIFDSPVGEERLVNELQDMLSRYLFDKA